MEISRYSTISEGAIRRVKWLHDYPIDCVLDVGANVGQFAQDLRLAGYGGPIVSFEPLPIALPRLRATAARGGGDWRVMDVALGDREGDAMIHVAGNTESSSMLAMNTRHVEAAPHAAIVSAERVRVRCLDGMIDEIASPQHRLWLKIDVQGFEGAVFRGGIRTLETRVDFVDQEVSLTSLYDGQELIDESLSRMAKFDFEPVAVEEVFVDPNGGETLQLAMIFRRRGLEKRSASSLRDDRKS